MLSIAMKAVGIFGVAAYVTSVVTTGPAVPISIGLITTTIWGTGKVFVEIQKYINRITPDNPVVQPVINEGEKLYKTWRPVLEAGGVTAILGAFLLGVYGVMHQYCRSYLQDPFCGFGSICQGTLIPLTLYAGYKFTARMIAALNQ